MRARPPANAQPHVGPSAPQPPLAPHVPLKEIQSLIPRLTTAINDIDSFKAVLAAGNADGTMPSWDTLIHRYSLLFGRLTSLSSTISQLPPLPQTPAGLPARHPRNAQPTLARYLVHPLNPLPANADAMAQETFFQVINTMPLPAVSEREGGLLAASSKSTAEEEERDDRQRDRVQERESWHSPDELRRMDEGAIHALVQRLRTRLEDDSLRARRVKDIVAEKEEEVDWGMRIGEGDGEGEEAGASEEVGAPSGTGAGGGPRPRGWQDAAQAGSSAQPPRAAEAQDDDDLFVDSDDE